MGNRAGEDVTRNQSHLAYFNGVSNHDESIIGIDSANTSID